MGSATWRTSTMNGGMLNSRGVSCSSSLTVASGLGGSTAPRPRWSSFFFLPWCQIWFLSSPSSLRPRHWSVFNSESSCARLTRPSERRMDDAGGQKRFRSFALQELKSEISQDRRKHRTGSMCQSVSRVHRKSFNKTITSLSSRADKRRHIQVRQSKRQSPKQLRWPL